MKKKTLLILLVAMVFCYSCESDDPIPGVPDCVETAIIDYNNSAGLCSDASVEEYIFQGKTVYVFQPGTCGADMQANVIDENCTLLGALGGILGNTLINGEDFTTATFIKTVWRN